MSNSIFETINDLEIVSKTYFQTELNLSWHYEYWTDFSNGSACPELEINDDIGYFLATLHERMSSIILQ